MGEREKWPIDRGWVDLNKTWGQCIKLTTIGTREDLTRLGLELTDGLALRMWTDDLDQRGQPDPQLLEGTARWDAQQNCWMADIDWDAIRHASDEA